MTVVHDLATWLLEQITEDERRAEAMVSAFPDERALTQRGWLNRDPSAAPFPETLTTADVMAYMLDMGPRRVLAECDAKRRVIRWVNTWPWRPEPPSSVDGLLPALALPYADRPGYREEWRP